MEINAPPSPACNYPVPQGPKPTSFLITDKKLLNLGLHCACPLFGIRTTDDLWRETMNTILEFTEGHPCRAGGAPWSRSRRRRDVIISSKVAVGKEDSDRGRNGSGRRMAGRRRVGLCVHKQADSRALRGPRVWVLWSREDNSEGSSL